MTTKVMPQPNYAPGKSEDPTTRISQSRKQRSLASTSTSSSSRVNGSSISRRSGRKSIPASLTFNEKLRLETKATISGLGHIISSSAKFSCYFFKACFSSIKKSFHLFIGNFCIIKAFHCGDAEKKCQLYRQAGRHFSQSGAYSLSVARAYGEVMKEGVVWDLDIINNCNNAYNKTCQELESKNDLKGAIEIYLEHANLCLNLTEFLINTEQGQGIHTIPSFDQAKTNFNRVVELIQSNAFPERFQTEIGESIRSLQLRVDSLGTKLDTIWGF